MCVADVTLLCFVFHVHMVWQNFPYKLIPHPLDAWAWWVCRARRRHRRRSPCVGDQHKFDIGGRRHMHIRGPLYRTRGRVLQLPTTSRTRGRTDRAVFVGGRWSFIMVSSKRHTITRQKWPSSIAPLPKNTLLFCAVRRPVRKRHPKEPTRREVARTQVTHMRA